MQGRKHGAPPYRNVVVHGGPGAPGSAYGLAKGIEDLGALEPFQTARTLVGQINELAETIEQEARLSAVLIGHSWGAMLAALVASARPERVRKLVLVCSGGFTAESYVQTRDARMARLTPEARARAEEISELRRARPDSAEPELMLEYVKIVSVADAYDPDPEYSEPEAQFQNDVNKQVWAQAVELRESGELAERVKGIKCPVVALHGDYDPHPVDAVAGPLGALECFRTVVVPHCGHEPWKERQARELFFALLRAEIS